ncbi:MAG: hypothetical protein GY807_01845, partial [Gammaproteobacteria bacterium]|nr:hypothetical protein [Gammaproteobacteria bacterium]
MSYDTAVYPDTITYPNNKYRVVFARSIRHDYADEWNDNEARVFYKRSRLAAIRIEHYTDGGNWELVRKYAFTYIGGDENDTCDSAVIFPGYDWEGDNHGCTLTLTKIEEYGINGTTPLPATEFVYDGLHLTEAENGYGGKVDFAYESSPWYELTGGQIDRQDNMCRDGHDWEGDDIECGGPEKTKFFFRDTVTYELPTSFLQPGATYEMRVEITGIDAGETAYAGIKGGGVTRISVDNGTTVAYLTLPVGAGNIKMYARCEDGECRLHNFSLRLLPTRYRVETKTLSDATTNASSAFTYAYDEPANND